VAIEGRRGKSWQMRSTAFLPADRKAMLFPNLTVGDNLVVRLGTPVVARRISGFLRRRRRRTVAVSSIRRFGVRTEGPDQQMPALSGGNQQKVAIAAALLSEPEVLVCEEPTRGVDVGSKAEIYSILRDSARSGLAVVVFCTEVPEVYELADRVLVVSRGSICMDARVADFADPTALAEAIATAEEYGVADMQIANRVGR
jgi:ribose transport system ATP-binding protein